MYCIHTTWWSNPEMNCVKRVMLRLAWIKTAMADLDPLTRLSKLGLFWSPSLQAPQNSIADPDPVGVILLGRNRT